MGAGKEVLERETLGEQRERCRGRSWAPLTPTRHSVNDGPIPGLLVHNMTQVSLRRKFSGEGKVEKKKHEVNNKKNWREEVRKFHSISHTGSRSRLGPVSSQADSTRYPYPDVTRNLFTGT
jgi:hypothetical protein